MSTQVPARPRVPRAAFGAIVRNEARLVWRQPAGMIAAIGISLMLLVVFDEVHVFKQSDSRLGGLSAFQLYNPMQLMPGPMLNISHFTPLGTSVQAIVYPMFGEFPPAEGLLVLAAYALVFGFLAMRFFRWE
jgi:hypothetical protein